MSTCKQCGGYKHCDYPSKDVCFPAESCKGFSKTIAQDEPKSTLVTKKNPWTRFKHWLIKKLGGYVVKPIEPHITYSTNNVVSISASVKVDGRYWFGERADRYRDAAIRAAKRALADTLVYPEDCLLDVIQIDIDESRMMEDRVIVSATIRAAVKQ